MAEPGRRDCSACCCRPGPLLARQVQYDPERLFIEGGGLAIHDLDRMRHLRFEGLGERDNFGKRFVFMRCRDDNVSAKSVFFNTRPIESVFPLLRIDANGTEKRNASCKQVTQKCIVSLWPVSRRRHQYDFSRVGHPCLSTVCFCPNPAIRFSIAGSQIGNSAVAAIGRYRPTAVVYTNNPVS